MQIALQIACKQLDLRVVFNELVVFKGKTSIEVPAHVFDLGAPKGMLVFTDSALIWPLHTVVVSSGYGFSILGDRPVDHYVDLEIFKEMFRDWEWSGESGCRPNWF